MHGRARALVTLAIAASLFGCRTSDGGDPRSAPASGVEATPALPPPPPPSAAVLRVGNEARGVEAQPDYDAAAASLRDRLAPRMPDPLPGVAQACDGMVDAVLAEYVRREGEDSTAVTMLRQTQAEDRAACEARTSAAAAACVAMAVAGRQREYPWLLDQCTRAFPR